jgi:hypothetical protein
MCTFHLYVSKNAFKRRDFLRCDLFGTFLTFLAEQKLKILKFYGGELVFFFEYESISSD